MLTLEEFGVFTEEYATKPGTDSAASSPLSSIEQDVAVADGVTDTVNFGVTVIFGVAVGGGEVGVGGIGGVAVGGVVGVTVGTLVFVGDGDGLRVGVKL